MANVVESFVVNAHDLVSVLNQLVKREGGVVRLDDSVGHFRAGHNGVSAHHSVGEVFSDLGDEEGTHTRTSTTAQRVGNLETLQAIAVLSLLANNIQNVVNKFGTFGVVTLSPVVTYTISPR